MLSKLGKMLFLFYYNKFKQIIKFQNYKNYSYFNFKDGGGTLLKKKILIIVTVFGLN